MEQIKSEGAGMRTGGKLGGLVYVRVNGKFFARTLPVVSLKWLKTIITILSVLPGAIAASCKRMIHQTQGCMRLLKQLVDVEQLDLEDERGIAGNVVAAGKFAVAVLPRHDDLYLVANMHLHQPYLKS